MGPRSANTVGPMLHKQHFSYAQPTVCQLIFNVYPMVYQPIFNVTAIGIKMNPEMQQETLY